MKLNEKLEELNDLKELNLFEIKEIKKEENKRKNLENYRSVVNSQMSRNKNNICPQYLNEVCGDCFYFSYDDGCNLNGNISIIQSSDACVFFQLNLD